MNWNKVFKFAGKIALYICLITIVVINVIKIMVPSFSYEISSSISMSLIGTALIAILAFLDKLLTKKKVSISSYKFFDGLNNIFSDKKIIESLDVFAYTSRSYCACIRDADIIIKKVRLLVHKPLPSSSEKLTSKFAVSQDTIALWQDMLNNGKIRSLEIKYYNFESTYHFAIIDNKFYHFGFYLTQLKHPGYSLLTSFSSYEVTEESECFRRDFVTIFNNYFSNYSYI